MDLTAPHRKLRDRITEICLGLPDAATLVTGHASTHTTYMVRTKKFAYHLVDHHGDGRIALQTRAAPGQNTALVESGDRFFWPPYMGHHGWIGLWLDRGRVDLDEVESLLVASYRLQAPKTLVAQLDR